MTPRPVAKRFVLTSAPTPPAAPELTFAALVAVLGHESHRSQEALVNLALDQVVARARHKKRRV